MKKLLLTLIITSSLSQNTHAAMTRSMQRLTQSLRRLKINPYTASSMKFLAPGMYTRFINTPPNPSGNAKANSGTTLGNATNRFTALNKCNATVEEFAKYVDSVKNEINKEELSVIQKYLTLIKESQKELELTGHINKQNLEEIKKALDDLKQRSVDNEARLENIEKTQYRIINNFTILFLNITAACCIWWTHS